MSGNQPTVQVSFRHRHPFSLPYSFLVVREETVNNNNNNNTWENTTKDKNVLRRF